MSSSTISSRCRKIVCVGRNYVDHINELSSSRPSRPLFFLKPASSLLPPPSPSSLLSTTSSKQSSSSSSLPRVVRPRGVTLHYEVELGVVIGRRLKDFRPAESDSKSKSTSRTDGRDDGQLSSAIAAYCLAVDLTARNIQSEAIKKGLPWTVAKGFDTFCPVSELIGKEKLGRGFLKQQSEGGDAAPHAGGGGGGGGGGDDGGVRFWLKVDGVEKQQGDPRSMIFKIPTLLREISSVMTLEEGDLVLTGTPRGVGPVVGGQKIECGIQVKGKEVEEGRVKVVVTDAEEAKGGYEYKET